MRSGDESKVSTHYFTQWGVTCRTAASAAFYTGMRPDCGVPGPKKFIYLADQGATVFRSPTPCFSVLNVRRRKRPAQKNNKQKKAQQQQKKKKNVVAVVAPTATMTQAQKIAGLRAVLKRHIKKPAKQEAFVDEPAGVEVRASLVQGAGKGLFTTRPFQKGEILCTYYGTQKTLFQMLRSDNTDYMMGGFGLNCWLDALEHPRVMARYINDNKDQSKISVRFVKCKGSDESPPHAKIEALRDIEKGEELYISYGDVFWKAKGGMH